MAQSMYPELKVSRPLHPSRWYAIPLLGFLVKILMVLPISIELIFLRWAQFSLSVLNSCGIFFRGRYWKMAYELNMGIMRLEIKVSYFVFGLSDTYPGFSLGTYQDMPVTIDFNKKPNRILATPLLGVLFRFILMIPYLIYRHFVSFAATLAMLVSWIPVLFKGYYPETTYEIMRDAIRVDQATTAYFLGLSDTYPSFWISMNHKALKILLLILAILLSSWSLFGNVRNTNWQQPKMREYQPSYTVHSGYNTY